MTDRDRLMRLERIVLGDGVDEPGVLTRLATIQAMLERHITETAMPTRSTRARGACIGCGRHRGKRGADAPG
jgi:hypothetical protein